MQKKIGITWKIYLLILCLGILVYGFTISTENILNVYYLIGNRLIPAVIMSSLFYFIFCKKIGIKAGGIAFISIYISLILSGLIGAYKQSREDSLAMSEIHARYNETVSSLTQQTAPERLDATPPDFTTKSDGDLGILEKLSKELMYQVSSSRNNYQLELEAVGWNSLLDMERLKNDQTLIESQIIVKKTKEITAKYKNLLHDFLNDFREKIKTINIQEKSKKEILSEFNKEYDSSIHELNHLWDLQEKIVLEYEGIINLMSANKKSWTISDGKILFYNDNDLIFFNNHIKDAQKLFNEQQSLVYKNIDETNERLGNLHD